MINLLKKIGVICIELAVVAGLLLYVSEKKDLQSPEQFFSSVKDFTQEALGNSAEQIIPKKPFPVPEGEVLKVYNWEYKGEKYSLTEKLYQSTYEYYRSQPKKFSYVGELKQNWEDEYYGMFLNSNEGDKSISVLSDDLRSLGKKHNLSDDQIVELTLAFVQSIPYDDAKAKNILAKTGNETMLYPYETLYEQAGVCSDKSLLSVAILRQMGYGTSLFAYEADNHMAIGIACPQNYSTYGSGYCYSETTSSGNKVGIIPSFDSESNKTISVDNFETLNSIQSQNAKLKQLGEVTIYQKTTGKEYLGIVQTQKILQEIDSLKKTIETLLPSIQSQKKSIKSQEEKLNELRNSIEQYQKDNNIEKYNSAVKKYNDFLESYKKDVKKYNNDVGLYNKAIQRYNVLIKQ